MTFSISGNLKSAVSRSCQVSQRDPIQCTLKHVHREENGYVYISYRSSDDRDCQQITVNGKQLEVRVNLFNFLQLSQKRNIRDWPWISAIYIDQENITERYHPVTADDCDIQRTEARIDTPWASPTAVKSATKLAWPGPSDLSSEFRKKCY